MRSLTILLLGLLADRLLGEPKRWHPLVGFGRLADIAERLFYGPSSLAGKARRIRGVLATTTLVAPLTTVAALLSALPGAGFGVQVLLLYLCLGATSLRQHALAVAKAQEQGDLMLARQRVARMVSRDTAGMDAVAVNRAAVESVLENGADALFGALFWFLVAGAPGAICYRLINTLDAMWGYRNAHYGDFGWFAARLDDAANWIPARLTALGYAAAGSGADALRCWRRQGKQWESPNAGPVMAAGAGALNLTLGGPARYHGEWKQRPDLGCGIQPSREDIRRACRLVDRALTLWMAVIAMGAFLA